MGIKIISDPKKELEENLQIEKLEQEIKKLKSDIKIGKYGRIEKIVVMVVTCINSIISIITLAVVLITSV